DLVTGVQTCALPISMAAGSNSNSAGPGSAISSKRFSAAAAAARLSADSAAALRQRSAAPMSKRISWSHLKKRCTDPPEQFRYGEDRKSVVEGRVEDV